MKFKPIAIGATLAALALILSACSGVAVKDSNAGDGRTAPQAPASPKPVPPEPGPLEGSREAPYPYGLEVSVYDGPTSNVMWLLQVGEPRVVTQEIMDANQFNPPPQPGFDYVAIPTHAAWQGTDPIQPWIDFEYGLDVAFVTTDGVTMDEEFVVTPEDWVGLMDVGDLYQGGAVNFTTVVQVPTGATGTVRVTVGHDFHSFWG
jgi:hypothetical protein